MQFFLGPSKKKNPDIVAWINPPTFGNFFIQVDLPFETIRYCGFWWNNCVHAV